MATITLRGQATETCGKLPPTGHTAPAFTLLDNTLHARSLSDFTGCRKLIYTLPSLDTPVCATSTRKLVEHLRTADQSSDNVSVLIISADLPFAQQRFCTQHKLESVTPLSLHRDTAFGHDYGLLITDGPLTGLLARAILVLDEQDTVLYTELVDEIGNEPDYSAALAALKSPVSVVT
jgi:thiol peroxidase